MEQEIRDRIYSVLHTCGDLNWHSWHWWKYYDEWFAQFDPTYIDSIAEQMALEGKIETNGTGYRRKEKTLKEKIRIKLWGKG